MLIVIWRTQWLRLCFIYFHVAKSKNAQTLVITACKFVVLFIILTVETTWWSYPSCRLHFVNVGHIILINFHILDRRWKIYFYEPSRLFHVSCTFTSRSHLLLYFTLYHRSGWVICFKKGHIVSLLQIAVVSQGVTNKYDKVLWCSQVEALG